jgi:hypothetical protein
MNQSVTETRFIMVECKQKRQAYVWSLNSRVRIVYSMTISTERLHQQIKKMIRKIDEHHNRVYDCARLA